MELTEIGALLVKAETVYGTDPTPTGALNAIPTAGDQLTWSLETQYTARRIMAANLDGLRGFNSLPNCTLKFRYELRGNRTTGVGASDISEGTVTYAVEIAPILAAADLNPTYSAASPTGTRNGNVSYRPKWPNAVGNSITCYWYTGSKLHKLVGGKVDLAIVVEPGKMVYLDVTVRGKYVAVANSSIPGTLTYLATKPPTVEGATFSYTGTVGSWNPVLSRLEFSLGNQIVMRPDALASDGVAGFIIGGRQSTLKTVVESDSLTPADPFADLLTPSSSRIQSLVLGPDTGNKLELTCTGDITKVDYSNDGPRRMYSLDMRLAKSSQAGTEGSDALLIFS